jgi:hypothetical protein
MRARGGARAYNFYILNLFIIYFIFILKPHPDSLSVVSGLGRTFLSPWGRRARQLWVVPRPF